MCRGGGAGEGDGVWLEGGGRAGEGRGDRQLARAHGLPGRGPGRHARWLILACGGGVGWLQA